MKTKTFLDADEAVRYAHNCQQGGYDCALVVNKFSVVVCELDNLSSVITGDEHIEYFRFEAGA